MCSNWYVSSLVRFVVFMCAVGAAAGQSLEFDFESSVPGRYRPAIQRIAKLALGQAVACVGPAQRSMKVRVLRYHGSLIQSTGLSWATACARPDGVEMALSPFLFKRSPYSSRPGRLEAAHLASVLRHELTHVLLHQRFDQIPAWLDEGLAQLAL